MRKFFFSIIMVAGNNLCAAQESTFLSDFFEQRKQKFEASPLKKQVNNQNELSSIKRENGNPCIVTLKNLKQLEDFLKNEEFKERIQKLTQGIREVKEGLTQDSQAVKEISASFRKIHLREKKMIKRLDEFLKNCKDEDIKEREKERRSIKYSVAIVVGIIAPLVYWFYSLLKKKRPRILQ